MVFYDCTVAMQALGWSMHSEHGFRIDRNLIVDNKIKMQPSEFQSFQVEHSKTLSVGQEDKDSIRLEKLRCTHSIRSMRYLTHGFHTVVTYSTISRTYIIYVRLGNSQFGEVKPLKRMLTLCRALDTM